MDKQKKANEEQFIKEYQELCEKHKMRITVVPKYQQRDDGTFSTVIEIGVDVLPTESESDNQ